MTDKTTIGVSTADMKPIRDLALALGQTQLYAGHVVANVSGLFQCLAGLVCDFGPRVVAAALQPARLALVLSDEDRAAVAEAMQEGDDEHN